MTSEFPYNTSSFYRHAFPPPEPIPYRNPDTIDTFTNYKYRSDPYCNISSLDLHLPFSPLCTSRQAFLRAFSGGGRIGFNAPYMPRDCDMRWFSTEEACKILSRFERVIVVGDSMMRHVVGALNVILRKDLGYGAVTQWNFNDEEMRECFCNRQFDVKQCSVQGIFSTSSVLEHDPESWACSSTDAGTKPTDKSDGGNVDLVIEMMLRYPLDPTEVERFQTLLSSTPPTDRSTSTTNSTNSTRAWP
jgi:hypothetical protein